jgi:hypothetical protein
VKDVGGLEEAMLHGGIVNIETKRMELEGENVSRNEIRKRLADQYRVFSRKQAFTCPCCDEPVNMNLTVDEGRPFYFKHLDGKECTYSENSKTYDRQISSHQDKKKKDIWLTVFKEIFEGQLKPYGAMIERGYFFKTKLSFIPDFIVKFPFSKEIWAVDYYTSISQGGYTHNLAKRMNTYQAEGFKVFSFIDDYWLAINSETDKGTLLNAEMFVSNKSNEDQQWDQYINQELLEAVERSKLYHEMMRKSEEQVELELLQRAKAASERRVESRNYKVQIPILMIITDFLRKLIIILFKL